MAGARARRNPAGNGGTIELSQQRLPIIERIRLLRTKRETQAVFSQQFPNPAGNAPGNSHNLRITRRRNPAEYHVSILIRHVNAIQSQDAAFQERPQFPFHKKRHNPAALLLPLQKRFKILPDHAIQNAFFRTARTIHRLRFANHAAQARTVTAVVSIVMPQAEYGNIDISKRTGLQNV